MIDPRDIFDANRVVKMPQAYRPTKRSTLGIVIPAKVTRSVSGSQRRGALIRTAQTVTRQQVAKLTATVKRTLPRRSR